MPSNGLSVPKNFLQSNAIKNKQSKEFSKPDMRFITVNASECLIDGPNERKMQNIDRGTQY
jgi:hypothetical protein